ncbi:MAG TPA: squalene/phytoene synthase family protein, partial [Thalassobaculum sp.]
ARAAPTLIASGRHPLPEELLQDHHLSHEQIKDKPATTKLMPVIEPIVQAALGHLDAAGRMPGFRAPPFRPLRLLVDRARDHARSLSAAGYEPAAISPVPPAGLAWRHAGRMLRYRLWL